MISNSLVYRYVIDNREIIEITGFAFHGLVQTGRIEVEIWPRRAYFDDVKRAVKLVVLDRVDFVLIDELAGRGQHDQIDAYVTELVDVSKRRVGDLTNQLAVGDAACFAQNPCVWIQVEPV